MQPNLIRKDKNYKDKTIMNDNYCKIKGTHNAFLPEKGIRANYILDLIYSYVYDLLNYTMRKGFTYHIY